MFIIAKVMIIFKFHFVFLKNFVFFSHWRKNKSLRFILRSKHQVDIKPNTRVIILAGNDFNPCASLKNNISWFRGGQAEFNDLRFLGASGRGLIIHTFFFQM
jgi:hypothetical protein